MDVSKNSGTPKSSILIEFSILNHPFWGTPILEPPIYTHTQLSAPHWKAMVAYGLPVMVNDLGGLVQTPTKSPRWNVGRFNLLF